MKDQVSEMTPLHCVFWHMRTVWQTNRHLIIYCLYAIQKLLTHILLASFPVSMTRLLLVMDF